MSVAREISEILIVDDDPDFISDLLKAWRPPGPVAIANSGKDAVEYLSHRVPSLVLLDLTLPHFLASTDDMEGLFLLWYVTSHFGKQCPVIVVSGETSSRVRARAKYLDAAGFLAKPINVDALEKAISRVTGKGK